MRYIEAGEPAPAAGYWMPIEYGQDVATGWSQAERDRDAWQKAYNDLLTEVNSESETLQATIAELKTAITVDGQKQREIGRNQTLFWILLGTGIGVWAYNQ